MSVQRIPVSRPLRVAVLLFAGMAVLFTACAPFVPGIDLVVLLGAGWTYCLLLALFGVGLGLACLGPAFRWWILSSAVALLSMAALWLLQRFGPDSLLRILPGTAHGLLAVWSAWLLVGMVVAISGWIRYARWYWSEGAAEPPPPPAHPPA